MQQHEYVAQPTAAAIDTAMARALSFESESHDSTDRPGGPSFAARVRDALGQSGSFERGFVQAAGLLVGGLLLGRLVTENTALLSAIVPVALLASLVTHKVLRGIEPARHWLATRPRQIALGIACSPALTWLSRGSFSRSERATLWTAWTASLIGVAALAAS